ncbi:MAG: 30S ribosomal protein S2 [Chitinophagales bacterium]|nr:30S ribosomal protein S2 [Chitinophagales bacterium]
MAQVTHKELLDAGVHFGHLRKKWNPKMLPYIFMEKKGIHIIDLYKTKDKLDEAANALKSIARSGKKILFVATKKQAKVVVEECAKKVNMPYVTERWLGGMLTNFATVRKSVKKMQSIEKLLSDPSSAEGITKKERLVLTREKEKLEKVLGGVAQLNRLPSAIYLVDIHHEHISLAEANKLNITSFGMVDTNSDPNEVDFAVPANDDASKSIAIITNYLTDAILEGLQDRKKDKDDFDSAKAAGENADEDGGEDGDDADDKSGDAADGGYDSTDGVKQKEVKQDKLGVRKKEVDRKPVGAGARRPRR